MARPLIAEARLVAVLPLEVVDQGPHGVASQRHPVLQGSVRLQDVLVQEGLAGRVIDAAIGEEIREGRAVLCHQDPARRVHLVNLSQGVVQAARIDLAPCPGK